MLILTRKNGQSIHIGDDITITVKEIRGNQIRLGVDAPSNVKIYRDEIYSQIVEQNKLAKSNTSVASNSLDSISESFDSSSLSISEGTLIFEQGLIGLEDFKEFQLITAEGPFFWFQSKKDEQIKFLVLPLPDSSSIYKGKVNFNLEDIDFKSEDEVGIFLIVSVDESIEKSSVNEIAPLVVNFRSTKGKQLLVDDSSLLIERNILEAIKV